VDPGTLPIDYQSTKAVFIIPAMRLLFCSRCKTLEELPDFTPRHKMDVDPLLEELVRRHNVRDPMAHGGEETLPLSLMHVDEKTWMENRPEIIKGIKEKHPKVADDADFVLDSVNTFKEDAMACYIRHRRPEQCVDYRDSSKRIGRPTAEGQRAMKDLPKQNDPYLCDFCPCQTAVTTAVNFKRGLYKE
jgi:hypothetical protein